MDRPENFFPVTGIVQSVKKTLEQQFRAIWVQGEISNFSRSGAGHVYFSLKDESSSLSCALFRGDAARNPIIRKLENGSSIFVFGDISVYPPRGTFQLIAKRIVPEGQGALKAQFDMLQKKLEAEGLFSLEKKRAIPTFPRKVAILTAKNGAALQDFIQIIRRRSHLFELLVVPCLVQGHAAASQICSQLERLGQRSDLDVVVVARGGGSLEDLWAFNDESLARLIARFPIPVVSAVGHQTDFTLVDFVSDFRCETPSAAAELLTQGSVELTSRMKGTKVRLLSAMREQLYTYKGIVQSARPEALGHRVQRVYRVLWQRLLRLQLRHRAFEYLRVHEFAQRIDDAHEKMQRLILQELTSKQQRLQQLDLLMQAYHPKHVLERGYVFIKDSSGKVVQSSQQFDKISEDASMSVQFADDTRIVRKGD